MGEQVAGELGWVAAGASHLLDPEQDTSWVLGDHRVDGVKEQLGVGSPEQLQHVVEFDMTAAVGDQLVEGAKRVAEAAGCGAGDRRHSAGVDLDLLRNSHPLQHLGDLLQRGALEVKALAAVGDRRHHLVRLGRRQHEDRVRRRLLQRLQEGVPGLFGQHVRLVEDVDLPAPTGRRVGDPLAQVADVVDGAVGGCVHLDHVDRGAGGNRQTRLAFATRIDRGAAALAIERAGEDLRHRGLAGAARADEEVGVVDLALLDRIAQGANDVLLADHLVKGAWAVTPVKGGRVAG